MVKRKDFNPAEIRTARSKAVPLQSVDYSGGSPCQPRICRVSVPVLRTSGTQWVSRIRDGQHHCMVADQCGVDWRRSRIDWHCDFHRRILE